MNTRTLLLRLALFAGAAGCLHAQFGFSYRSLANPTPAGVDNNGSITFPPALVGTSSDVTLIGRNNTQDTWTIGSITSSSPLFKVSGGTPTVAPQTSFLATITFTPATPTQATSTLTIQAGSGANAATYTFFLFANGQAPQLVSSYVLNPDGNQVAIGDTGTITFPPTAVAGTATATFILVNRGNGTGTVTSASLTGDAFKLTGLPLLPATVDPGKDFRFTIAFSPTSRDTATGLVKVVLPDRTLNISLTGQGTAAVLSYDYSAGGAFTSVNPNDTVHVPAANVGATSTATVRVRNTGNADARVGAVSITGAGFRVTDLPPLPATVVQGGALTFTIAFTPTATGLATARLQIDAASFGVDGTGNGARLTYSSRIGSTVTPIPDGGSVSFPNTNVGDTSSLFIQIANTGNAAGSVSAISAGPAAFTLSALPALPVTIGAGQTVEFSVAFAPTAVGQVGGTLQIDDRAIPLRGVGNAPPPLPSVSFTGLTDTTGPLQQPAVGVTLAAPYSIDLTGTLTLSFTPDSFVDDPSVQFSTGGRTINFRIPANTTQAIFGDSAKSVQFQAGTVAGVIAVSATFAAGAANVTPSTPPSKSVLLPAAAPQIRNVQIGTRTANGFEVLITGFSTTRAISGFSLDFTGAPGASLGTTHLDINVDAPFTSWYQSATGKSFGSQFTASVIINVAGDINAVQAVSVTASNARGASNSVSANLR